MSTLDDDLRAFLSELHVEMESTMPEPPVPAPVSPEVDTGGDMRRAELAVDASHTLFQTSREHYGVSYRVDLMGYCPQMRVLVPDDGVISKFRIYIVIASPSSPIRQWFAYVQAHRGSCAWQEAEHGLLAHLLFAAGEAMKRLFWDGVDAGETMWPAEITVTRLK